MCIRTYLFLSAKRDFETLNNYFQQRSISIAEGKAEKLDVNSVERALGFIPNVENAER